MKSPSMHRQRGSVATIGFVVASMLVAALVVGAIVPVPPASAAGGDLDPSFGGDGKVTTDFTVGLDAAAASSAAFTSAGVAERVVIGLTRSLRGPYR